MIKLFPSITEANNIGARSQNSFLLLDLFLLALSDTIIFLCTCYIDP